MKNLFESSLFTKLTAVLGILVVAFALFWLGTIVGFRQAAYSSRWAGNYAEVFGGDRSPFTFSTKGMGGGMMGGDHIMSSNGAVGTVMAVHLPTFAVKGLNEAEKVVIVSPQTVIRKFRAPASST